MISKLKYEEIRQRNAKNRIHTSELDEYCITGLTSHKAKTLKPIAGKLWAKAVEEPYSAKLYKNEISLHGNYYECRQIRIISDNKKAHVMDEVIIYVWQGIVIGYKYEFDAYTPCKTDRYYGKHRIALLNRAINNAIILINKGEDISNRRL